MDTKPRMSAPRDAASLLLLRQDASSLKVLMGMRHAGHQFMPNKMVFPGGGVDAEDATAPVSTPLRAGVIEQLSRSAKPKLAAALGAACARELDEETGLSLGNPPALDGLNYLCRAVTPEGRLIRFNARFFIADATLVTGTLAGSGELESLGWYELETIVKLDLAGATRAVLNQLQIWLTLSETERRTRRIPVLLNRSWQEE